MSGVRHDLLELLGRRPQQLPRVRELDLGPPQRRVRSSQLRQLDERYPRPRRMSLGARRHANRRRSAAIDLWCRGPDRARRYEGPRAAVVGDSAYGARMRVYLPRRHLAFPSARAEAAREAHGTVRVEEKS